MYLDANNLHGWATIQYLPTGGFRWMSEKKLKTTWLNTQKKAKKD